MEALLKLNGNHGLFIFTEDQAAYLSTLINNHHHDFATVYSNSNIIPKIYDSYPKDTDSVMLQACYYEVKFCMLCTYELPI